MYTVPTFSYVQIRKEIFDNFGFDLIFQFKILASELSEYSYKGLGGLLDTFLAEI